MSQSPLVLHRNLAAVFLAFAAVLAVGGCTKPAEVQPSEGLSQERFDALEKRLQTLEQERDAAVKSAGAAGLEAQNMTQVLADLRSRLKAVEERAVAAPAAMSSEGGTSSLPASVPGTVLIPAASDGTFSEEQIAVFAKISDEVQKRKDAIQQADRVRRMLKSAGLTLSAQQEEAVIRLQAQYQQKMREVYQGGFGTSDAERQETRDKLQALRGQWETDLRSQLPAAEADQVVESMSRGFPGVFPRRIDGRTGGMTAGMNGN